MKSNAFYRGINHPLISKHATREQMAHLGRLGAMANEAKRLSGEPPIYNPLKNKVTHAFFAINVQNEDFIVSDAMILLNKPRRRWDSYSAIINGELQEGHGGIAHWQEMQRKALQVRFFSE